MFFMLVGLTPLAAFVWLTRKPSVDYMALVPLGLTAAIFVSIGLLGLSMVIQGARNRPGIEGFFYRGIFWIRNRVTPAQATVAPFAAYLAIAMQGLATHDIIMMTKGMHFALVWSSLFVQLFLHEVGHLVAVRRARLPFLRLVAGPVKLVPHGRHYRFGTNREWLHLFVGAVYYEIESAPSARKTFSVAAAGPIATACIGLLAVALRLACTEEKETLMGSLAYGAASANAVIAVVLLLTNLIPLRLGRFETDGRQMWHAFQSLRRRG